MLKNITRQLFAQLSRHLPHRLIARDPLPNANTLAGAEIPASLTERCLNVAAMDENEVWRAFGGHPEGLNAQEVSKIREEHGDNQIPAQNLSMVGPPVALLPQSVQPAADGARDYLLRH